MDASGICLGCMRARPAMQPRCPYCGFSLQEYERHRSSEVLPAGTVLNQRYLVGKMLGKGGFGITYLAFDQILAVAVALKEYFPVGISMRDQTSAARPGSATRVRVVSDQSVDLYNKGLKDQEKEAVMLAQIGLPGVVNVIDFFLQNGTGYIVMKYVDGVDLRQYVRDQGRMLSESQVLRMMRQVLLSLGQVHRKNIIHRDISPDNIMIDRNGQAVLIDFGAARQRMADTNKSMTVLLKHGYAPPEQYSTHGLQGPWTDVYALSATLYYLMTGEIPADAVDRMSRPDDEAQMLAPLQRAGVSQQTQMALLRGMGVHREERFQNMEQLYQALYQQSYIPPTPPVPVPPIDDDDEDDGKGHTLQIVLGIVLGILVILSAVFLVLATRKEKEAPETTAERSDEERARELFETGMDYYEGSETEEPDMVKAQEYFLQAEQLGSAQAALYLGYSYETGQITGSKDYQTAREHYLKAYEGGEMRAAYHLGDLYERGLGVSADVSRAASYYQVAVDQPQEDWQEENWRALEALASLYETGETGAKDGAPDYETAMEYFTRAAAHGMENASYRLGRMYEMGEGLSQPDYEAAMEHYQQAAQDEHPGALNNIGRMYEQGLGVDQDYARAAEYYERAADAGSAPALFNLGLLYENGNGVPADVYKAMEYYRQARDAGIGEAAVRLDALESVYGDQAST